LNDVSLLAALKNVCLLAALKDVNLLAALKAAAPPMNTKEHLDNVAFFMDFIPTKLHL
jgi:hypothetical protein